MTHSDADRNTFPFVGVDVEARVGRRSRYASVALVTVLFGVSFFAVWSSQATSSAATRAAVAIGLSDDYATAASAVAAEESLERKYRLEPGPDVQAKYDEAASAFVASLALVRRDGSANDRSFVEGVLSQHESYLEAIDRLFRATDRGDTAEALKVDTEEVDPSFGAIEAAVLDAAEVRHQESLSQLGSLQTLEHATRVLTPLVFVLGLVFVAALAGVSRGHRRLLTWLSKHYEGILASVGEGVVGVDTTGEVVFANPAAADMLGHEAGSLLGMSSCVITCPDSLEAGHVCVRDLVREAGDAVTSFEGEFVRVDGSRFPAEITAAPRKGPDNASGVVLVFRDVSERTAMSRMKRDFVSTVSHELRTPLTSIRGALELLDDGETGDLSPMATKIVATALRGSERLTRLINDIIDVERIESGSFNLHVSDVEVRPMVDSAVSELQVLGAQADVRLVVTEACGWIRCDADRLVQALVNLIGNAVKFSPPDSTVRISAQPQGSFMQFTVADSGCGVPAGHEESIFERFNQGEASAACERAGAGLGLAITKSIVEQHGGRIWVESVPGRGSTFMFTMPRGESETTGASHSSPAGTEQGDLEGSPLH